MGLGCVQQVVGDTDKAGWQTTADADHRTFEVSITVDGEVEASNAVPVAPLFIAF